jgi:hyperosmotically inducible protein
MPITVRKVKIKCATFTIFQRASVFFWVRLVQKQGFLMKNKPSQASLANHQRLNGALPVLTSLVLALALSACSKPDDNQTAGQKLDSAIAKTEQAAAEAKIKSEQSAAQAKAKTEEAFANAGAALKNATQNAESSAKVAASKAIEKMDDMAITAAISTALAKDPDLSAFKINVDTKDGAVTLNGSAPTEAARERAGAIAKTFNGVQSVDNKLIVKAS